MKRALGALLLVVLPSAAGANARAREGTVAIMPSFTMPRAERTLQAAPGLLLSFGFKPSAALEVGIDLGYDEAQWETDEGKFARGSFPFGISFEWTPLPESWLRPMLTGTVGRDLIMLTLPDRYVEFTPFAVTATAGVTMDLSDRIGVCADAGYRYARAQDAELGMVDGGGLLARAGVYFRWDPIPKRGP